MQAVILPKTLIAYLCSYYDNIFKALFTWTHTNVKTRNEGRRVGGREKERERPLCCGGKAEAL